MSILDTLQLKILTPGTYWPDKQTAVILTKDDLRRMATVYNGKGGPKRPAPIVIGHPEDDSPAWGEVGYLHFEDSNGSITAFVDKYKELRGSLLRAINDGSVGRHAAQFFAPDNPKNPEPNTWYLKHLGFSGPPPTMLAGTLTPDVEFAEYVEVATPSISLDSWKGGAVFAEYASHPKDPGTIALLASSLQAEHARYGRRLTIAECVNQVMGNRR